MVTILSSTECENVWNTIINKDNFDSDYGETHWGICTGFYYEQIERNKPDGWNKLREVINDIEQRCVVYYCCEKDYRGRGKTMYFIVLGENAMTEVARIAVQLDKMIKGINRTVEDEIRDMTKGTGALFDIVADECPLF